MIIVVVMNVIYFTRKINKLILFIYIIKIKMSIKYINCINKLILKFEHLKDKNIKLHIETGNIYVCSIKWKQINNQFIVNIYICDNFEVFPDYVQEFLFAHELGHLEHAFINKIQTTDDISLDNSVFNTSGFMLGLISSLGFIYKQNNLFIIPIIYSICCLYKLNLYRNLEYDADKRACKVLKSNKGGIRFFTYIKGSFIDYITSMYKTHPCHYMRLKNIQ